ARRQARTTLALVLHEEVEKHGEAARDHRRDRHELRERAEGAPSVGVAEEVGERGGDEVPRGPGSAGGTSARGRLAVEHPAPPPSPRPTARPSRLARRRPASAPPRPAAARRGGTAA